MGHVLTKGSTVTCQAVPPPPPAPAPSGLHGGTVTTVSSAKLTVSDKPVLLKSSVAGQVVTGCQTPSSSSTQPCKTVGTVTAGTALKLTVGGDAVLIQQTLAGTTAGVPAGQLGSSANQSKLTAS